MNSTTLICKRCKAPLEYEEGSAILRCSHCGYTEKINESDTVTIERIRAKTYKDTELEKSQIEKDAMLKEKKLNIEEKSIWLKKARLILYIILAVAFIGLTVYVVNSIQHWGKIHIKQAADFYVGTDYQYTHRLLEEAGFKCIEDSPQATLSKKEQELVGKVIRVSIDGDPTFKKGWYAKDATVTLYYGILDPAKANDIRMPLSRTDCIGKNYQTILDKLTSEGFHNIKIVPYPDLSMERKDEDGKISRITINNSELFYLGDYFAADSIIQIDYHTLDPERMADVMIPANYDSYINTDYLATCREFLKAGFTNITLIPKYDVKFYEGSKSGVIQSIEVNGESTFLKGVWLPYDTEVRISYRSKDLQYVGKDYEEVSKTLSSMGFFTIEYEELNDLGTKELKKADEVVSVMLGDTELSEASEINLLLPVTIKYHSEQKAGKEEVKMTASSKELTGEDYEEVVSTLKNMGFTRVKAVALEDLTRGIIHKDRTVDEISIAGKTKFSVGEIYAKNAEVIVSYHSFKPEPPASPEPEAGEGQVKISVKPKDLKSKDYQEVVAILKDMGFTNIKAEPLGDLKKAWIYDDGEVKEVSIGGETKFSINDIFDADVEIIVTYHSYPA